jgi:nuclear pore complex protein Nup133
MAYIYTEKIIYPVVLNTGGSANQAQPLDDLEKVEQIEFQAQDDKIMNAANHNNIPLFFSRNHGLVCVTSSDFEPDFLNSSVSSEVFSPITASDASMSIFSPNVTNVGNLTMYDLDPEEIYDTSKDTVSQLKAAFIYHLKRNHTMCTGILKELLKTQTGSNFDRVVLTIAQDLSEDVPAADPRWEVDTLSRHSLGSSTSLQIIQQLREKSVALNHFIEFLHATDLWGKLGELDGKSTSHLLSDISEKIVASIALKCLHNSHTRIVDEAIDLVLKDNQISVYGNLTNQDLFYTKITKIQETFKKFVEMIENYVNLEYKTQHIQNAIIEINTIVLNVLQEVMKFRESKEQLFKLPEEKRDEFEYLPWTAGIMKDTLLQLIALTLKHGIKSTGEPEYKFKHYQHMTELIDFVLDGRRKYLQSVKNQEKFNVLQHQYESQRFDLIFPLIDDDQFELAAKLAEKYLDFQTLVIICDRTNNQARLDEYIERFKAYVRNFLFQFIFPKSLCF